MTFEIFNLVPHFQGETVFLTSLVSRDCGFNVCLPGEKARTSSGDSGLVYLTSHPGEGPGKRDGWECVTEYEFFLFQKLKHMGRELAARSPASSRPQEK